MQVVTVSRKPLEGTVSANALRWGTGSLNINGSRIGLMTEAEVSRSGMSTGTPGYQGENKPLSWAETKSPSGRWPANLLLQHLPGCVQVGTKKVQGNSVDTKPEGDGGRGDKSQWRFHPTEHTQRGYSSAGGKEDVVVWACASSCPVAGLDAQSGLSASARGTMQYKRAETTSWKERGGSFTPGREWGSEGYGDKGGASRYFKQVTVVDEHMNAVPQDLIDYLVTMISPPDMQALFWGALEDKDLSSYQDKTIPGLILRGQPTEAQSSELLRILMPGAHLLLIAPDDEPTGHTGTCRIEDAGFEIRDSICWANEAGDDRKMHYVPKAARSEREAGCHNLPAKSGAEAVDREEDTAGLNNPRAGAGRTASEVHNFHPCLHPDAVVMTDRGYRPIQDIVVGDQVFAADGVFHSVAAVTRHPYTSACLYKIAVKGSNLTTLASDNHPFLIWRPRRKGKYIQGGEVIWAPADQIIKGDYTMTPVLQSGEGSEAGPWSRDTDFWFVFGLWLAEGMSQKAGHGENCYPSFSLHAKETYLVDRIRAVTTKNVSVYKHGENGIQVMVFDPDLGSDFKRLGGSGASTKTIDPMVWTLTPDCRKALVDGYMAGDGGKVRTYVQAKSVSTALASQITYLAESIGYKVCLYWFAAKPGKIGDRVFKTTLHHYQMQFYSDDMNQTTRKPARPTRVVHEGVPYSLRYVQTVDKVPYQGDVVNLSVDGSPTFQTAVGMSHNTVKPIDLMVRLLSDVPKDNGPILDPFMGSGTTGVACIKTGHDFIGIERESEYLAIDDARVRHWRNQLLKGDRWDDVTIQSDYVHPAKEDVSTKSDIEDVFGW